MSAQKISISTRATNALLAAFSGTRLGAALDAFLNRYESAIPSSPRRSYVPSFVRDARFDANSFTRWELSRKARYFEANNWLFQRLCDLFEQYTVGPNGLQVIPQSSDSEWNKVALESWQTWCQFPDVASRQSFATLQGLIARSWFVDGDCFIVKTYGKDRPGKQAFPRVQLIESHRCSSPGQAFDNIGLQENIVDGVQVDAAANGRPTGYWIRDGFTADKWIFKSTDDVIHVFEPSRIGMYRGITFFHAVLAALQDLNDLQIMEMERAKEASSISNVLESWSGELDATKLRSQRFFNRNPDGAPPLTTDESLDARINQYALKLGSRMIAIRPGEKITQFNSNQPSAATQWYWDYLVGQVCLGVGISKQLAMPSSMQGTVARGDLAASASFFRSRSSVVGSATERIYNFYMQWARYNDPKLYDAPSDWYRCMIVPPASVDVDQGRSSVAKLAGLQAGTLTFGDIYGEQGQQPEYKFYQKAREVASMKRIADEVTKETGYPVSAEEIGGQLADTLLKVAQAEQADAQADALQNQPEELEVA